LPYLAYKMIQMKSVFKINYSFLLSLIFTLLLSGSMLSQTLPGDLNNMSDEEVYSYWKQAEAQGYTLAQIKAIAKTRGVSQGKIDELEQKLIDLENEENERGVEQMDNALEIIKDESDLDNVFKESKDPLFGYDFFNNSNITFAPNVNLATPANYQLGPGDEMVISIWGAAENTYNMAVDREGAIRISGIGPVYVNGLSIVEATKKIKGSLSRIYSGINDSDTSPYKVFVGVSLSNVRTVQVDIIGEVKVPGTYSLNALSSVLNALYASGGPTKQGTFRNIKLIRNGGDIATFDIYKYLLKGSQEGNKNLQDGDVIIVSPYISRIMVSGAVKRPGVYEIKSDENFGDLIDFMSGFTSNAYKDLLLLERIDGDRRKIKEVLLGKVLNETLRDGDKIIVNEIIDKFENRVQIEGAVYRPGVYELIEGLTVKDLITKAAGIRDVAFVDRGLLFSTKDGVNQKVTPFSVSGIINGENDITLAPNDLVRIFNKYSLTESSFITVDGAVNSPDQFSYMENMTIEDLILLGGGLKEEANAKIVDVYRKISDNQFETLSESFKVSANGKLTFENGEAFILEPNDRVSVRFLKGFSTQVNVSVLGEVNYPGAYSMEVKDMKISDLIEDAGGVSPYAFIDGGSLIRLNPYYKDKSQSATITSINDTGIASETKVDLNNETTYRVGIDLKDVLANKDSMQNLVLKDGDVLEIPSIKQTVKVEGDVLVPSLIRYEKGATLKDYIDKSGGFGFTAKKGKTFVVHANGDISSTKHFLFFRSYPKLSPGAIVLVPTKIEDKRNKLSAAEIVALTTSVATLALLIQSFTK
jgi:protein involved in polysaccharide export with SLBB domain